MHYLKVNGTVIAFSDPGAYALARYAVTFPDNVYNRNGGGYTIFNHRTAILTDVLQSGVRDFRIGWLPSKDAASVYKTCHLLRGGNG